MWNSLAILFLTHFTLFVTHYSENGGVLGYVLLSTAKMLQNLDIKIQVSRSA